MMAGTSGYISVKEYAALHGITIQAVYKNIRAGKIESMETTEGGRKVKYVKTEAPAPTPEADAAADPHAQDPAEPAGDPLRIALDLLGAQLQEKDRQIERLQADIKEKDAHIREQATQLAELLRNSQQLQAHAQHLLEPHGEDRPEPVVVEAQDADVAPTAPEEPPEDPPKKRRGFWERFWGE